MEVTRRVQELEQQRQAQQVAPAASITSELTGSPGLVGTFIAEFTVRVDVALPKWNNIYGKRDTRFTVDLESNHTPLIWTIHILANGGQGNFDAVFPVRWSKSKDGYGIMMRFNVYLRKGFTFVGEDEKHFGGMINDGAQSDLHHYCVAKFMNETDESLNLVTAKNVHTIKKNFTRCRQSCCQ